MVLGGTRGDWPRLDNGHRAVFLPRPLSPLARKATVVGSLTTAGRADPSAVPRPKLSHGPGGWAWPGVPLLRPRSRPRAGGQDHGEQGH